jgi:hypothetical protein
MNLQIACPHCHSRVRAPAQMIGQSVKCPSCQQTFVVTDPNARATQAAPSNAFENLAETSSSRRPARRKTGGFVGFLTFRVMIAPVVIQILFWLGVIGCLVGGAIQVIFGVVMLFTKDPSGSNLNLIPALLGAGSGLGTMVFGPFVLRLYAEFAILLFRSYDVLTEIRDRLDQR